MDNKVYAVRCPDYTQVEEKLAELLALLGGLGQFAAAGEKIVLKVNLLQSAAPDKVVTTHPAVVTAIGRLTQQTGATALIADSPGAGLGYDQKTLERVYHTSQMDQAAQAGGLTLNFDTSYETVSYPQGNLMKLFEVMTPVRQASGVFNLCKLKTHTFMMLTGAVKNNFGVIPGRMKVGYHATLQNKYHFADMLLDLACCVSPRLSLMDAVVAMEGDGPNAGTPRRVGWLLAATNPLALDVVAGEMIGLNRAQHPVLVMAEKRGLSPHNLEQVELIGADIADLRVPGYKLPSTLVKEAGFGPPISWLTPLFKSSTSRQPRVMPPACVACGECMAACPVEAITMADSMVAYINDKKCIRCYCCHEMCPNNAIELKSNFLYRMIVR